MHRAFHIPLLGSLVLVLAADCNGLRLPASRSESAAATPVQPASPPPAPPKVPPASKMKVDASLESARFNQIRGGLRRLVVAEENYYAENGIYTEDLARIGFRPEADTRIQFLWSSRAGWGARASHPDLAGQDCVVYVGREHEPPATTRYARTGKEGVPVCDERPAARRQPAAARPAPSPHQSAPAAAVPDTTSALDQVTSNVQMRVDLRNLVRAQDSYRGNQGVYSRRM